MSTKQMVLNTLLIFFFILMLVAIGMWFKSDTELSQKKSVLALQKALNANLKNIQDDKDDADKKKLRQRVEVLEALAATKATEVAQLKSNEVTDENKKGVAQREAEFKGLESDVDKAWKSAQDALKKQLEDRKGLEKNIDAQLVTLAEQRKTNQDTIVKETAAFETAQKEREIELAKIAQEKAKMDQDLEAVRYEREATTTKLTEVSRDLSKVKKIVSQGKITRADAASQTAFINLGSRQGVRKGMIFDIYSGAQKQLVKKGRLQIAELDAFSAKGILLAAAPENRVDKITGWIPDSPKQLYSPFAADGPEETNVAVLEARKTVADRINDLRIEKIKREQGEEAAENARSETNGSPVPPSDLTLSMSPVEAGDWIFNADFIPLVSTDEFHVQMRDELKDLRDVNIGPLTFYFTKSVKPDRREYLRRQCETNGCKVVDTMNPNVNVVVTSAGTTDLDAFEETAAKKRGKADLKDEDKNLVATADALKDARKYGAMVRAEDTVEGLFELRQRKKELLYGSAIQPGRSSFFIAGKTKQRSPELLAQYIKDNGGIVAPTMESKVDYVVVGETPDEALAEKVKKLGLKIVREEELPELLGVK